MALLLMAWWIIPLVAKHQYTVEFGRDWDVTLLGNMPRFGFWLLPPAACAVLLPRVRRSPFVAVHCSMLAISLALYLFGNRWISPVFTNVRLWPFIIYSLLALAAAGSSAVVMKLRTAPLVVLVLLLAAFCWGVAMPNDVERWARWNYEGLQKKEKSTVLRELLAPLHNTKGRLANDLHPQNVELGSSRIFESVPHLIGKPILEGGIVNSAAGSLFSYYIQSETSRESAGLPNMVEGTTFDFTNATRHLELFNVKHFIARWPRMKNALSDSEEWSLIDKSLDWELHQLNSHDGSYVVVPKYHPMAIHPKNWKEAGLQWMYHPAAIDQHFALLKHSTPTPSHFGTTLTDTQYLAYLSARQRGETPSPPLRPTEEDSVIIDEEYLGDRIRFVTSAIGKPHIIKCTYFPNWKVRGAPEIHMVTPCFMLIYPTSSKVELYYGYTLSDYAGMFLSGTGLLLAFILLWLRRKQRICGHLAHHC